MTISKFSRLTLGTGLTGTDLGDGELEIDATGGGGGAPTDATYITQTANGSLSAEQALSSLATGVVKVTTTTGVLSTATEGTDYYKPGGTDVAVADGGTGASSASAARTNLGLVIATDVEAHDADLTTIAGLTPTNDDVIQRKAGAWTNRTLAQLKTDLGVSGFALETPGGTINGSNDTFTLSTSPTPSADLLLFKNGLLMKQGVDYTLSGTTITFDAAQIPPTGATLLAAVVVASGGSGSVATDAIWDAKGDLVAGTGADAASRVAVGSNDQVLVADSTQTAGVKWAAVPAGSGGALALLYTLNRATDGTFDQASISGAYNDLVLVLISRAAISGVDNPSIRFNNDSGGNYYAEYSTANGTSMNAVERTAGSSLLLGRIPGTSHLAGSFAVLEMTIQGYASTTWLKSGTFLAYDLESTVAANKNSFAGGFTWNSTAAINRIQVAAGGGNLLTGTQLRIYGRL